MTTAVTCDRPGCLSKASHAVPLTVYDDPTEVGVEFWCADHVEGVVYGLDDTVLAGRVAGPVRHLPVTS